MTKTIERIVTNYKKEYALDEGERSSERFEEIEEIKRREYVGSIFSYSFW